MHTPWLTNYILTALLDSHSLPVAQETATGLQSVRDEVASGHYDAMELERRLRQLEQKDLYVHSLTYALLRLAGSDFGADGGRGKRR